MNCLFVIDFQRSEMLHVHIHTRGTNQAFCVNLLFTNVIVSIVCLHVQMAILDLH